MLSSIVQIVKDMSACGPSRHFGAAQLLGRFRVNGHQPGGHKTGFMSTRPSRDEREADRLRRFAAGRAVLSPRMIGSPV